MPGVEKTMHEFKTGKLRSGSGQKVTSREQAIAIALSQEREAKKKKRKSTDGEKAMSRWSSDKEFSTERREELAKKGKAMPGGGYPIENKGDLKNAISAFGRAKNKPAAKAWIKKRARELGATEMLPENWDSLTQLIAFKDDAQRLYDDWQETSDEMRQCPDCDGAGKDEGGFKCETCDGEGYIGIPPDLEDARRSRNGNDDDEEENGDDDNDDDFDDARTVHLTDQFMMDGVRKTTDGYLVANARISRTGIQLYSGHEVGMPDQQVVRVYRPPEEVFSKRSMHSLAHRPITLEHPPNMVDAINWRDFAIGHTGDEVTRDGDCVRVPMVIMDAKAVEAYEKHGVRELSVGYGCELKWGKGKTPSGEAYDCKQTAIRGNHLAVVPAARGGSRLRIGDDQDRGAIEMAKILIGGQAISFDDELAAKHVQNHIAALQAELADAKKKADEAEAEEEQEEEKRTRAETDAATLKGEVAVLKKQLEDATDPVKREKAMKDSMELRLKATAALDGKVTNFDGKSDGDVRRIVVQTLLGDSAKDMGDHELVGAFTALTANIKPRTGTDRLADSLAMLGQGGGNNNSPKAMKDAAYEEYCKTLTSGWRTRPAAQ
jgi:hypothetical protein